MRGPIPAEHIAALKREPFCMLTGLPQRMADRVTFTVLCGCWEWTGWKSGNGYGRVKVAGIARNAHQASYELLVAPVPCGLVLHHLCYTRACINPFHLVPDTQGWNIKDGRAVLFGAARY